MLNTTRTTPADFMLGHDSTALDNSEMEDDKSSIVSK